MSTCILNCVVDKWASGLIGIPKAQGFDVANHWPLDTFVSGFSGFFFFWRAARRFAYYKNTHLAPCAFVIFTYLKCNA